MWLVVCFVWLLLLSVGGCGRRRGVRSRSCGPCSLLRSSCRSCRCLCLRILGSRIGLQFWPCLRYVPEERPWCAWLLLLRCWGRFCASRCRVVLFGSLWVGCSSRACCCLVQRERKGSGSGCGRRWILGFVLLCGGRLACLCSLLVDCQGWSWAVLWAGGCEKEGPNSCRRQ